MPWPPRRSKSRRRAAQDHRDLLLDPGRGRIQRLAHGVRAAHRLPAALPVLRHGVRVHGRRVAHVRRDRSRGPQSRHALRLRDRRRAARAAALRGRCSRRSATPASTCRSRRAARIDIGRVDTRVGRVVDSRRRARARCTQSLGEPRAATPHDALKFVICDRADYDWVARRARGASRCRRCPVFFSPSHEQVPARRRSRTGFSRTACPCACRCSCTKSSGATCRECGEH